MLVVRKAASTLHAHGIRCTALLLRQMCKQLPKLHMLLTASLPALEEASQRVEAAAATAGSTSTAAGSKAEASVKPGLRAPINAAAAAAHGSEELEEQEQGAAKVDSDAAAMDHPKHAELQSILHRLQQHNSVSTRV